MRIQLGAYGFLAGTTVEKDGLPNAGLYDQRAVLQWIQDYIHLVGGDKRQVSARGQSAGASAIMHHLTAFGGTQDPLFSRAILQSPGHGLSFDRKGNLEQAFQNFATRAGCAGKGLACLRAANAEALEAANKEGSYVFFPSADGKYVRQLAILELASGTCLSLHPFFYSSFSPKLAVCLLRWTISTLRNII
jgi:carboxylesterase type B